MPRCPKCREEIDCLLHREKTWERCKFRLATKEEEEELWENVIYETLDTRIEEEYVCPECEYKIATTEEDAIKFLKGEWRGEIAKMP